MASTVKHTIPGISSETNYNSGVFHVYSRNDRTQLVLLASELSAMGFSSGDPIQSLCLRCGTSVPQTDLSNFKIQFQETSEVTSTTFIDTGWVDVYGPTTVDVSTFVAGGLVGFIFPSNYIWGFYNLLINIIRANSSTSYSGSEYHWSGVLNRQCRYHSNGGTYPFVGVTATATGTLLQLRLGTSDVLPNNAFVTQQYLEVAVQPSSPPNAVVTQQYIEIAYLDSTEPEPIEVLAADFLVLSDSSDSSLEDLSLDVLIGDSFSFSDEARGYLLVPLESIDQISFSDSNQSGFTIVAIAYDFILLADQAGSILKITLAAEDVLRFIEEIQSSRYNIAKGATRLKLVTSEGCYNITVSEGCYNITVSEPRFHIEVQ